MLPVTITARDIPDAWFQCVYNIFDVGFRYTIEHGSFVGSQRLEYDWINILITHPYTVPWDNMLPTIPEGMTIPPPVEAGYLYEYIPYVLGDTVQENEQYTYGSRLNKTPIIVNDHVATVNQIDHFIELFKNTPNTNQAVLQVAERNDLDLSDPPCLRHIDMRVKEGKLIFYPYFRSWDLWAGLPANLPAIAVLQSFMAVEIGVDIGPILASSKGLHLYNYVEELARLRICREGGEELG